MSEVRHTAIQCEHTTAAIRSRIAEVLTTYLADVDIDVLAILTTQLTCETSSIMIAHAEEIATEYKSIIRKYQRR